MRILKALGAICALFAATNAQYVCEADSDCWSNECCAYVEMYGEGITFSVNMCYDRDTIDMMDGNVYSESGFDLYTACLYAETTTSNSTSWNSTSSSY